MSAGLEKIAIGGIHQRERSTEHKKKKENKDKIFSPHETPPSAMQWNTL